MSYAEFCQDQASDCARRARLATSAQIAAYYQDLGWRWLRLAEQAQETGGALGKRRDLEALCPPRLHTETAVAKPQAANANKSSFRLRFWEKVGLPHFRAKRPGAVV
jgi:alpha-amylase/alpha-mannosidase (GH57 family)